MGAVRTQEKRRSRMPRNQQRRPAKITTVDPRRAYGSAYCRQAFLLGAAIMSEEVRDALEPHWFSNYEMQKAIADLKDDSKKLGCLEGVLRDLGVDWRSGDDRPVRAVMEHVEQDGELTERLACLAQCLDGVDLNMEMSLEKKRKTVEHLSNLGAAMAERTPGFGRRIKPTET